MFRHMQDFHDLWRIERETTERLFSALTDSSLDKKVHDDIRTLGRLAGHIVESVAEMGSHLGIGIAYDRSILKFSSTEKLLPAYRSACDDFTAGLKAHWNDAMLNDEIEMYGERWTRSKTLAVVIAHQAHHRSQMTVVMRLAGISVPGLYGPAKEEWAAIGMPAME